MPPPMIPAAKRQVSFNGNAMDDATQIIQKGPVHLKQEYDDATQIIAPVRAPQRQDFNDAT